MKKAMCLYSGYNICFIEVSDLPDEFMEKIKTAYGGTTLAEFEEFI